MSTFTVLIGEAIGPANLARLQCAFPAVAFHLHLEDKAFAAAAADADVIFSKRFPPAAMAAARRLRWVQAGTAGVERLLSLGLHGRGVLLTNASGAHGVPMAELILAQMLAFATGLHTLIQAQPGRGQVASQVIREKFELEGQTVCVIGLGDIGGTLARKCRALGMQVLGVRRSTAPFPGLAQQVGPEQLIDVLAAADHVALCLPLTAETRALVGAAELRAMRPSAYIYNVGRGASIDATALEQALQEGWIAGAGLDVTDPEPLPADSPLWTAPNVILSQHTSGSSPYNADRITDIFLDNLGRFLQGSPLQHQVDALREY